jgi:hypothetical protein
MCFLPVCLVHILVQYILLDLIYLQYIVDVTIPGDNERLDL